MEQQSLKTEKNMEENNKMRKTIFMTFAFSIISIMLLSLALANQEFEYARFQPDNVTLEKFASLQYAQSPYDNIKSGNPLEFYVWYHGNIGDWNLQELNNSVRYCTLTIEISKGVSLLNKSNAITNTNSTPYIVFQQNFTENVQDGRFFVDLFNLDSAYTFLDCVFKDASSRPQQFIMPMDFSIVTPTFECKACQFFNWATDQVTLNKARTLGDYTTANLTHIAGFFGHFYELLVIGFWVLLILLVLSAVGLFFFGIYWLFNLLFKFTKNLK